MVQIVTWHIVEQNEVSPVWQWLAPKQSVISPQRCTMGVRILAASIRPDVKTCINSQSSLLPQLSGLVT